MIYENQEITTFYKKKILAENLNLNHSLTPQQIKTFKCFHMKDKAPFKEEIIRNE